MPRQYATQIWAKSVRVDHDYITYLEFHYLIIRAISLCQNLPFIYMYMLLYIHDTKIEKAFFT